MINIKKENICFNKNITIILLITITFIFYLFYNQKIINEKRIISNRASTINKSDCDRLPGCWMDSSKICISAFTGTNANDAYSSNYCCFKANEGLKRYSYPHFERVVDKNCNLEAIPTITPTPPICVPGQNDTYGKNWCNNCSENIKYGECYKYDVWKRCKDCNKGRYNCLVSDNTCEQSINISPTLSSERTIPTIIITPTSPLVIADNNIIFPNASFDEIPPPYNSQITPKYIILHFSDNPYFSGNIVTLNSLKDRQRACTFAVDKKNVLQMQKIYTNLKIDKNACAGSPTDNESINIEIDGADFDLWINDQNQIEDSPKPNRINASNSYIAYYSNKIQKYGWSNKIYAENIRESTSNTINLIKWIMQEFNIPKENIFGHYEVMPGKTDPGSRYMRMIHYILSD